MILLVAALWAYALIAGVGVFWAVVIEQIVFPRLIEASGLNVDPDMIVGMR